MIEPDVDPRTHPYYVHPDQDPDYVPPTPDPGVHPDWVPQWAPKVVENGRRRPMTIPEWRALPLEERERHAGRKIRQDAAP